MSRYWSDLHYDKYKRNPEVRKFYNSKAWKELREFIMQRDDYLCVPCSEKGLATAAIDVHHIKKVSEHWEERLNQDNLISVCRKCHARADKGSKHDDRKYYFDENGFPRKIEEV